jgi:rhodanese-related sulfurtransferase
VGLVPNPNFLRVAEANFERTAGLIIGCHSGSRSGRAAEALVAAGFTRILHLDGGFGGVRNLMGQVVSRGWVELGLPVEYGLGQNQSYEALGGTRPT